MLIRVHSFLEKSFTGRRLHNVFVFVFVVQNQFKMVPENISNYFIIHGQKTSPPAAVLRNRFFIYYYYYYYIY